MLLLAANPVFLLFANNLINWLILVALLVYLWHKVTPAMFATRAQAIETALQDARSAKEEAQALREQQTKRLAQADHEAKQILLDARKLAEQMKQKIVEQTQADGQELARKITQQIAAQKQMAIEELRSQAALAAVKLAEAALPGAITDSTRVRLCDQFVQQLDGIGKNHEE
jgi:F-type H+-transporting ATPase subunit b